MDPQRPIRINATKLLTATTERDVTFQLPAVVSHRLDILVQMLERDGPDRGGKRVRQRTTSRKELLAALVFAAEPEQTEALLHRYRAATAGAAAIPAKSTGWVTIPPQRPGLRLTAGQSRARGVRRPAPRNRYSELGDGRPRRRVRT